MPKLYPEDQARVDDVLSQGIYKVDRPPFRFFRLLAILSGCLLLISGAGYIITKFYGFV